MTLYQASGVFLTIIAILAWVNYKYIKLPDTVGITAIGLVVSIVLTIIGSREPIVIDYTKHIVDQLNFPDLLLHGMLSLLLFAGSLHINLHDLAKEKISIFMMATIGVIISTGVIGSILYGLVLLLHIPISVYYCFLFGALISPTDPIAVIGVLQKSGVNKSLETKIAGESLFNDGTAVVAFMFVLALMSGNNTVSAGGTVWLLFKEIFGAVFLGLAIGWIGTYMLRGINSHPVEILITLAMAIGGYAFAEAIHVSAPIEVVVAGLIVGNHTVKDSMADTTREHLFLFWEFIDDILNIILFALIGVVIISLELSMTHIYAGLVCIPVALFARWISVIIPWTLLHPFRTAIPNTVKIMTWGGLRGGISIALALSLTDNAGRDYMLGATYAVVLFSLLVQATTLERLTKYWNRTA